MMPFSRKKACARCRQSKLRCDLEIPCSHCAKKRLSCIYNGRDSYPSQSSPLASLADPNQMLSVGRDIDSHVQPQPRLPDVPDTAAASIANVSVPVLDSGGGPLFEWDASGQHGHTRLDAPKSFGLETVELQRLLRDNLLPEQDDFNLFGTETGSLSSSHHDTVNLLDPLTSDRTEGSSSISFDNDSPTVSIQRPPDERTLRRRLYLRDCGLTSVVLGQLTGYPKMMLEGDILPPFIQAPCHSDEELALECRMAGQHKCFAPILAICSSLVEMFYSRTRANEDFVWETIYAEVARLRKNFRHFDRDEQLAATQAITVFILLQADDLKPVMKNDVSSLLMTAMECLMITTRSHQWRSDTPRVRPRRHEWAFRESLRRVSTIFCIIDLLLEGMRAPDGYSCESNGNAFGMNTLPCNRYLWEARTTKTWIMHYDRYLSTRESDETLTGNHLHESRLSGTSGTLSATMASKPDVLRWCDGLDSLGTLVWMVLPLHAHRLEQNRLQDQS